MIKCIYHSSDFDGECSAVIVKMRYPQAELIPMNYGWEFPWNKINKEDTVYMVDFCLPVDDMLELNNRCQLVWIDHHKSAIEELAFLEGTEGAIVGKREIGKGACELVWEYLYPDTELPRWVYLLSKYDVWDHSDPDTLSFQYGMKIFNTKPESDIWHNFKEKGYLCELYIKDIISTGKKILEYQTRQNTKICSSYSFETELEGYSALAINKPTGNSQVFDSVEDRHKYDIFITFVYLPEGLWRLSVYSDENGPDVTKIAGINGHKNAGGMVCEKLPFKLRIKK